MEKETSGGGFMLLVMFVAWQGLAVILGAVDGKENRLACVGSPLHVAVSAPGYAVGCWIGKKVK